MEKIYQTNYCQIGACKYSIEEFLRNICAFILCDICAK